MYTNGPSPEFITHHSNSTTFLTFLKHSLYSHEVDDQLNDDLDGNVKTMWRGSFLPPPAAARVATFDGFMDGSTAISIVECMGRLFPLIPAFTRLSRRRSCKVKE